MAHDARTRKKAQVLYEAGKSFSFIMDKLGVSKGSLIAWSEKGQWQKSKAAPELYRKEREATLSAAEKAGLSHELFFNGVRELVTAHDVVTIGPTGMVNLHAKPEYANITDDPKGRKLAEFMGLGCEVIPDRQARKDGLKLMLDTVPGLRVATQIEISPFMEALNRIRARHN